MFTKLLLLRPFLKPIVSKNISNKKQRCHHYLATGDSNIIKVFLDTKDRQNSRREITEPKNLDKYIIFFQQIWLLLLFLQAAQESFWKHTELINCVAMI